MSTIDEINNTLSHCAKELDKCSAMIRDAKLDPVKQNIQRIGHALTYIFEIQNEIYKSRPELKAEELTRPMSHSKYNRIFGKLLLEVDDLCERGEPLIAIVRLEEFLDMQPEKDFAEMARSQILIIKERFGV